MKNCGIKQEKKELKNAKKKDEKLTKIKLELKWNNKQLNLTFKVASLNNIRGVNVWI